MASAADIAAQLLSADGIDDFRQLRKSVETAILKDKFSDEEWVTIFLAGLKSGKEEILQQIQQVPKELFEVKTLKTHISRIIEQLMEGPVNIVPLQSMSWSDQRRVYSEYGDVAEEIAKIFGDDKEEASQVMGGKLIEYLVFFYSNNYSPYHAYILYELAQFAQWKNVSHATQRTFVDNVHYFLEKRAKSDFFEKDENSMLARRPFVGLNSFYEEFLPDEKNKAVTKSLLQLYRFLGAQQLFKRKERTVWGVAVESFVNHCLATKLSDASSVTAMSAFSEETLKHFWSEESALRGLVGSVRSYFTVVFLHDPRQAAQFVLPITEFWLKNRREDDLGMIHVAVQSNRKEPTEKIAKFGPQFVAALNESDGKGSHDAQNILPIISSISVVKPKVLMSLIPELETNLRVEDRVMPTIGILKNLASAEPSAFKGRGDDYLIVVGKAFANTPSYAPVGIIQLASLYAVIGGQSKSECERVLALMAAEIEAHPGMDDVASGSLANWPTLAHQHRDAAAAHRPLLLRLKETRPAVASQAQNLIDIIDGRSLAKTDAKVDETHAEVGAMEARVGEQEKDLHSAKTRIHNIDGRVNDAEKDIEDLDKRTVSNAPRWAHEVSLLLNPERSDDWRLVASRLNYGKADIRSWATTGNPTMSLLAELYSTQKTSEATAFLLKVLTDINRMDAHRVIRREEKAAESAAPARPLPSKGAAPVFLSYQWGIQPSVLRLKERLEADGHGCWLDVAEMGGGDSLYEEMDRGIRGAVIMVLCMSHKYTASANCQRLPNPRIHPGTYFRHTDREVNLGNGLGKRMLPLQMEKIDWPPEGSLGPILADRLFIRFYKRNGEATEKNDPWPSDKYKELLQQIREVSPAGQAAKCDKKDVLISYQWDSQSTARSLRKKLKAAGYSVWIDIAGASLEAELRVGMEQSRVVVVCLSKAYTKSANCVAECRLASSLHKPIVPLILESLRPGDVTDSQLRNLLAKESPIPFQAQEGQEWSAEAWDKLIARLARPPPKEESVRRDDVASRRPATAALTHVALFCSPDKLFEMKALRKGIEKAGYKVKILTYKDDKVDKLQGQVLMTALSLRFSKSAPALKEVSKWEGAIVPLLLDSIMYPPSGPAQSTFERLTPVDCSQMPSRSEWRSDGDEFEEILDRLEALVPSVQPIRAPKREKSSIPVLARDRVAMLDKPVPLDPLAREASEIRIQIRPPTPKDKDGSHIPLARQARPRAHSVGSRRQRRRDEDDDEEEPQTRPTKEIQKKAKDLQDSHKLPQLPVGRDVSGQFEEGRFEGGRQRSARASRQRYGQGPGRSDPSPRRPQRDSPPARPRPKPNAAPNNKSYWDQDGPKLPSLYRQRFVR